MSTTKSTMSTPTPQKNIVQVIRTVHKIGGPPPVFVAPKEAPKPISKPQVKTPPQSPRPDFLEPLSPTATQKKLEASMQERIKAYWDYQMEQNWFWEERIERLEKEREKYNKKRGWSARDLAAVEEIDAELKYCLRNLDDLKENEYYSEDDADFDETV